MSRLSPILAFLMPVRAAMQRRLGPLIDEVNEACPPVEEVPRTLQPVDLLVAENNQRIRHRDMRARVVLLMALACAALYAAGCSMCASVNCSQATHAGGR